MTKTEAVDKLNVIFEQTKRPYGYCGAETTYYSEASEESHIDADNVLREFLISLGYGEVIAAYDKISKWYA